jgi:hypothetical protein
VPAASGKSTSTSARYRARMVRAGAGAPREWIAWLVALLACLGACLAYQPIARAIGSEAAAGSFAVFPPLFAEAQPTQPPAARVLAAALPGLATLALAVLALRVDRTRATALLLAAAPGLVAWQNVAAAGIDGPAAWREPFRRSALEYLGDVVHVERLGPAGFAREYPRLISERTAPSPRPAPLPPLTLHGATHPPGAALVLWAGLRLWGDTRIDSVPLDRPPRERLADAVVARASGLAIGLGALAVLATGALAWLAHGRRAAAVAVALHAATPSLVWLGATSMDAVFLLAAAAVLVVFEWALADDGRGLARAGWAGVALGLAAAVASTLTYAVVLLALLFGLRVTCLLAVDRAAAGRGAVACGVGALTWLVLHLAVRALLGFDFVANVAASLATDQMLVGSGTEAWARYLDVSVANLVGFAMGCGPPTIALVACAAARGALPIARRRGSAADAAAVAWTLTVVIASFSTLFTLEVERVWLFLIPPALSIAAGELVRASRSWRELAGPTAAALVLLLAETLVLEARLYTWW